jgi:predicted RNA binding protein YcfA (HicA-like mRNA interferase family)|tara:strand:+ start:1290 stop:1538 length:249 start_codon:yes stop_codon:yes gene_type:complete
MSKTEKLLDRLSGASNTFNWKDLTSLLAQLGYEKQEMAGSRVRFYNSTSKHMIRLHKPHPENHIKGGALKDIRQQLKQEGYL